MTEEARELKPKDLCLGNFVECFGKVEMVMGLTPRDNGDWFIHHKAWNQQGNPIPDGVEFSSYAIPLTDDWKRCLRVDQHKFPDWIKYVHEAQNYMKWCFDVYLLENFDWDLYTQLGLSIIKPTQP